MTLLFQKTSLISQDMERRSEDFAISVDVLGPVFVGRTFLLNMPICVWMVKISMSLHEYGNQAELEREEIETMGDREATDLHGADRVASRVIRCFSTHGKAWPSSMGGENSGHGARLSWTTLLFDLQSSR